jgi:hypothetical protein
MLRKRSILFLLLAVVSLPFAADAQEIVVFRPVQETQVVYHNGYVSEDRNYSGSDSYSALCQNGKVFGVNTSRTLFQFDFSEIPPDALLQTATLTLFARGPSPYTAKESGNGHAGDNATVLERVVTDWNSDSVTWNTQPAVDPRVQVLLRQSRNNIEDYPTIDVLPLVKEMLKDASANHGFAMRLLNESPVRVLMFCSSFYPDPAKRPYLTLTYERSASVKSLQDNVSVCQAMPNPFSGQTVLKINADHEVFGTVEIYNLQGRHVKSQCICGDDLIYISLDGLPPGMYFYKLVSGNNVVGNGKLMVN